MDDQVNITKNLLDKILLIMSDAGTTRVNSADFHIELEVLKEQLFQAKKESEKHCFQDYAKEGCLIAWPCGSAPSHFKKMLGIEINEKMGWVLLVPPGKDIPFWVGPIDDIRPVSYPDGLTLIWFNKNDNFVDMGHAKIYNFSETPKYILDMVMHPCGGDETWVAVIPKGWSIPDWANSSSFSKSMLEEFCDDNEQFLCGCRI